VLELKARPGHSPLLGFRLFFTLKSPPPITFL